MFIFFFVWFGFLLPTLKISGVFLAICCEVYVWDLTTHLTVFNVHKGKISTDNTNEFFFFF